MADPVINASRQSLARETCGQGVDAPDCHTPAEVHVRIRSIPHVPTARLQRRAEWLHEHLTNPELLHEFDDPRRTLIHWGVTLQAINHEISLRKEH